MLKISGKPGQPWLTLVSGVAYPVVLSMLCHKAGLLVGIFAAALAPAGLILLVIVSFTWEMRRSIVGSRSLRSVGNTVLSFIFPVWMLCFSIPLMLSTPYPYIDNGWLPYGVNIVIWVILFTKFADIFAYVSGLLAGGRIFKEKRLIPHISPKKTWEGLIGSFILSMLLGGWLGIAMGVLPGITLTSIILMVILFVLSVIGDLSASLIKRSLSVKDSGSLLPGIGGIFDLIDSPAFTLPVVFYLNLFLQMAGHSGFFTK